MGVLNLGNGLGYDSSMTPTRNRLLSTLRTLAIFVVFLAASTLIISCATRSNDRSDSRPVAVPDELSLRADRSALAEERKNIPEEKRRSNDEIAMVLQLMSSKSDQEPSEIRDRFNKALRDRRERNDTSLRKRRDDFTKVERRAREDYLRKAKDERENFAKEKHSAEERKRMFDDQDEKRRDYFSNEADKRKDFESEITEARKTFEDYAKEKTDQFNQEARAYSADFYERKKQVGLRDRAKEKTRSVQSPSSDEFSTIPQGPGIQLGAPTNH